MDGILESLVCQCAGATDDDRQQYGLVDAVWIHNMNTPLDDNTKLCLSSAMIMHVAGDITTVLEVADLAAASAVPMSRCRCRMFVYLVLLLFSPSETPG